MALYPLLLPSFSGIPMWGQLWARWRVWLVWPLLWAKNLVERGLGEFENVWLGWLENSLECPFIESIFSSENCGYIRGMR